MSESEEEKTFETTTTDFENFPLSFYAIAYPR